MVRDEVKFVILGSRHGFNSKKVHVLGGESKHPISSAHSLVFGYVGHTLCGRVIYQYRGGGVVDTFPDSDLCVTCHHSFDGPKKLLFDHPIEEDL